MPMVRITAPATEPVTLAEAKMHCRVDGTDEDALISALIIMAREQAEFKTGRSLITQTWELVLDAFPSRFTLRNAPIQSITSVKYLDSTGVEQTLSSGDYLLDKDSEPGHVSLAYGKNWPVVYPVSNAVRVRFVAGYGNASNVPQSIKSWMLLTIGSLYAQRETIIPGTVANLPRTLWDGLLDPYRLLEA